MESTSYARKVTFGTLNALVSGSVSLPISLSVKDGMSPLRAFCEGDDFVDLDKDSEQVPPKKPTLTFRTKWIVPLLLSVIIDTHAISNKNLKQFLSVYGKDHALSDSILQEARSEGKAQLLGKADENVQYSEGMKTYLKRSGHTVELNYTSRKETHYNVEHLMVSKELLHLKVKDNSTLNKEGQRQF
jgi:hypothetical protein